MTRTIGGTVALLIGTALACSNAPQPTPLSGAPADLRALNGDWAGEYHSYRQSGRAGTIFFRLEAGQDSVTGQLLMHNAVSETVGVLPYHDPWTHVPNDRVISVTFVHGADGTVIGRVGPHNDPVCGCELRTVFMGRVRGNILEGTYTSQHLGGGDPTTGRWRVLRSF